MLDFDNCIFLHPYIYYMASESLQGEELFHSMYYLWPHSHAEMRLKSAPQKSYIKKLYTKL